MSDSGWNRWLEAPCLFWRPGDYNYQTPKHDPKKAIYTPEQEQERIKEEVDNSENMFDYLYIYVKHNIDFDIDFDSFRCVFNYHRAYLDANEFVDEPDTTGDLLVRLSKEALDGRNATYVRAPPPPPPTSTLIKTDFEFASVVKANFHYSAGFMFLITFEVRDPYDGLIKPFQARVRHLKHTFTEHVFCRPKPNAGVEYYGTAKTDFEKDTKKQRLE
uniref:Cystatin domain-containing protein n=1 Tax=Brassica oleracea var. oleracea TaxID=109376 RepID=A0A0D3BRT5_BRAOL